MQRLLLWAHRCVAAAWLGAAMAATAQLPPALITPLELRTCDFADGKGRADLDLIATELNRWMSESGAPDYAAHAWLPLAHSREIDFDFAWVGTWPDGTTMGESMAHYVDHGGALASALDSVMACRDNRNFSVLTLRPPEVPGRFGPAEESTCKLRLGAGLDEALAGVREWVEYTATIGSTAAHWLLFPAYGERSDASYSFKWVVGYESFEAFGRDYDQLTNGSALDRYNDVFEHVMRCDSPRLYAVRTIRAPRE